MEKRILHGDTSGVCYNCLNGFHEGCGGNGCTCAINNHKAWWWKTESEIKKEDISEWYKDWCKKTNRSGGVLITTSIKELLVAYAEDNNFQKRVDDWMQVCFGEVISKDKQERNHRFIEEALELVQACGATKSECHQLVDYVFDRPVGEINQETGGVMVTLAALCLSQGIDMNEAGETELKRIWTKVDKIREKQANKPKHSPLP